MTLVIMFINNCLPTYCVTAASQLATSPSLHVRRVDCATS